MAHQNENVFYREATFYYASEVARLLLDAGFLINGWGQTLSQPLPEIDEIEPLRGRAGTVSIRSCGGNARSLTPGSGDQDDGACLFEVFSGQLRERFPLIFPSQRSQERYYFSDFIAGKVFAYLNFAHYPDCIGEAIG